MALGASFTIGLIDELETPLRNMSQRTLNEIKKMGIEVNKQGLIVGKAYEGQAVQLREVGKKWEVTNAHVAEMTKAAKAAGIQLDQTGKVIGTVSDATKKVTDESTKYNRASSEMRLVTGALQQQIGILRNQLLLVAFAYQLVKRFLIPVVEAAREQENAERRLHYLMVEKEGLAETDYRNALKQSEALQKLTGFADDQILVIQGTLAMMRQLTTEQKNRAIPVILDLAAAYELSTGQSADLERITKMVSRALKGSTDSLIELGINLGRVRRGGLDANQILSLLEERVGGLAQRNETFNDVCRRTKSALSDLKEAIGMLVIPALKAMIEKIKIAAEWWTDLEKRLKKDMEKTNEEIEIRRKALEDQIKVLETAVFVTQRLITANELQRETYGPLQADMEAFTVSLYDRLTEQQFALENLRKEWEKLPSTMKLTMEEQDEILAETMAKWKAIHEGFTQFKLEKFQEDYENFLEMNEKKIEEELKAGRAGGEYYQELLEEKLEMERWAADELMSILRSSSDLRIKMAMDVADSMQKAYSDLFFDLFTGQLKTAEEYFISFGQAILRTIANTIAQMIVQHITMSITLKLLDKELKAVAVLTKAYWGLAIAKAAAGVGGGMGGAGVAGGGGAETGALKLTMHRGGKVESFQQGGVLLEAGEGIVSRRGMGVLGEENLARLNRGERIGGDTYVIINAIDTKSFRERLLENGDLFSSTVYGDIEGNRPLRSIIRTLGG